MEINTTKTIQFRASKDLSDEDITYETRGGIKRKITSAHFAMTLSADSDAKGYLSDSYRGYNIRKDGTKGAEFRDAFPHLYLDAEERIRALRAEFRTEAERLHAEFRKQVGA
ncbi:MAG: hypothetical protein ACM3UO_00380 [Bacillota bacterium]